MEFGFNLAMTLAEQAAEGGHGGGLLEMAARLLNFAILAGTLVYLLRSPIAWHLGDRGTASRGDLVKAAGMRTSAGAQLAGIEKKMAVLMASYTSLLC